MLSDEADERILDIITIDSQLGRTGAAPSMLTRGICSRGTNEDSAMPIHEGVRKRSAIDTPDEELA